MVDPASGTPVPITRAAADSGQARALRECVGKKCGQSPPRQLPLRVLLLPRDRVLRLSQGSFPAMVRYFSEKGLLHRAPDLSPVFYRGRETKP